MFSDSLPCQATQRMKACRKQMDPHRQTVLPLLRLTADSASERGILEILWNASLKSFVSITCVRLAGLDRKGQCSSLHRFGTVHCRRQFHLSLFSSSIPIRNPQPNGSGRHVRHGVRRGPIRSEARFASRPNFHASKNGRNRIAAELMTADNAAETRTSRSENHLATRQKGIDRPFSHVS